MNRYDTQHGFFLLDCNVNCVNFDKKKNREMWYVRLAMHETTIHETSEVVNDECKVLLTLSSIPKRVK